MNTRWILLILLLTSALMVSAQREVPELWGTRVHDEAHVLSAHIAQALEQQLKLHEDSTSNQIAILIIASLQGEAIEEYSLRVAEKWQLGQKGKDNGVLLLVAIDDRKMRIEVGYGLEGVLPDAVCSQIIRNEMAPNFRRGDYDEGVQAAINAIVGAIAGEYSAGGEAPDTSGLPLTGTEKALMGLFIFGILGIFTFAGLTTDGCAGWFLYAFLIPFYAIPIVIFGLYFGVGILITYLIAFPILKLIFKKQGWAKKFSSSSSGGWSSGSGWISGGDWSSGGDSGGFSGGGGSFGGGGSSGSW